MLEVEGVNAAGIRRKRVQDVEILEGRREGEVKVNLPPAASSGLVGRFRAGQPVRDVAQQEGIDLDREAPKSAQEHAQSAIGAVPKQVGDAVDLVLESSRGVRARRDGVSVVGQHSVSAQEERERWIETRWWTPSREPGWAGEGQRGRRFAVSIVIKTPAPPRQVSAGSRQVP